jgi:hypothetical protein
MTGITRDSVYLDDSVPKLNKRVFKCMLQMLRKEKRILVHVWVSIQMKYSKNQFLRLECECYYGSEFLDGHETMQHLSPDQMLRPI